MHITGASKWKKRTTKLFLIALCSVPIHKNTVFKTWKHYVSKWNNISSHCGQNAVRFCKIDIFPALSRSANGLVRSAETAIKLLSNSDDVLNTRSCAFLSIMFIYAAISSGLANLKSPVRKRIVFARQIDGLRSLNGDYSRVMQCLEYICFEHHV